MRVTLLGRLRPATINDLCALDRAGAAQRVLMALALPPVAFATLMFQTEGILARLTAVVEEHSYTLG